MLKFARWWRYVLWAILALEVALTALQIWHWHMALYAVISAVWVAAVAVTIAWHERTIGRLERLRPTGPPYAD